MSMALYLLSRPADRNAAVADLGDNWLDLDVHISKILFNLLKSISVEV